MGTRKKQQLKQSLPGQDTKPKMKKTKEEEGQQERKKKSMILTTRGSSSALRLEFSPW